MKIAIVAALVAVVGCGSTGAKVDAGAGGASRGGAGGAPTNGAGGAPANGAGGASANGAGGAPRGGAGGAPVNGTGGAQGDGGVGVCRANSPLGASVSWLENGVPKCASSVFAQRSTEGANQLLQLQGTTLDGGSIAFAVVAYGGPLEGTHVCSVGTPDGALIGTPGTVYVDFVHTATKQACSVTITNGGVVGGANATGTFTATFTGPKGASITNGIFDSPVRAPPSPPSP